MRRLEKAVEKKQGEARRNGEKADRLSASG
jgi:hypothetical protein